MEKNIYSKTFPKDSKVKIANRSRIGNFLKTWTFHNKLKPEQLSHAGQIAEVESVGFYHGGDELYKLKGIPGIWHKQCLKAVGWRNQDYPKFTGSMSTASVTSSGNASD